MQDNLIPPDEKRRINVKNELSLAQLFRMINNKKGLLFYSIIACLLIALAYNFISQPIYESFVIVKKDENTEDRPPGDINQMFSMRTTDELETEIEVIKTTTVLGKVINQLNLSLMVDKVEYGNGKSQSLDMTFLRYDNLFGSEGNNSNLPRFLNMELDNTFGGGEFFIQNSRGRKFEIYHDATQLLLASFDTAPITDLSLPGLKLKLDWASSKAGDRIYFTIDRLESVVKELQKRITVSRIGKTNLAKLTVQSNHPQSAKLLVDTIIEKYKEVRFEQKRQTVQSSYEFVDSQLQDVKLKLEKADFELSQFKSENKISIINENAKQSIEYLSNLEAEKNKTDLELLDYRSKVRQMQNELNQKGYYDQTYLTPQGSDGRDDPFSVLLNQLSNAEIQRLTLLQKRKENHPDVITVTEQITQIKRKLNEYNQNTMTSYNILIKTLQSRSRKLSKLISQYSGRIEKFPDQEANLIRLTRDKNAYEKMFTLLLDKREEFRLAELSKLQDIVIVESARVSYKPVAPRHVLNLVIALVFGSFIGLAIIVIRESSEKKITTLEDIEEKYPFPLLTIVPKYDKALSKRINKASNGENRLVTLMDDQSIFRESYRVLNIKLRNYIESELKGIMISSCEENTGKTSVSTNFAASLARSGKKVLLIDGDLRKASVGKYLNDHHSSPGLIDLMSDDMNPRKVIRTFKFGEHLNKNLDYILTGGLTEYSSEILESDKMKNLIDTLSPNYDYIIIDAPPLTRVVDPLVIGSFIKDLVLVLKPNHTFRDSMEMAMEEIKHSRINMLGFVINAGEVSKLSNKYKYGYGYGYSYGQEKKT